MSVKWSPVGNLDVASNPADLPISMAGKDAVAGGMTRCTNLHLDRNGIASTRKGISRVSSTQITGVPSCMVTLNGVRYLFVADTIYRDEVSIGTGYDSNPWFAVIYNPYNSYTESVYAHDAAGNQVRIEDSTIYQWGINPPGAAPASVLGAATGLTGNYMWKFTFCRKEDSTLVSESNPSPQSIPLAMTDDKATISWIASSDPQVTHVRLYRTVAGGTTFYYEDEIAIGTTSYTSGAIADTALGSIVPSDHDRPRSPGGQPLFGPAFNGTVFRCRQNNLDFSKGWQIDYWPESYYVECSQLQHALTAGCIYANQAYVADTEEIYQIQGTQYQSIFPLAMSAICGSISAKCFVPVLGHGIFHLGYDGIYKFNSGADVKFSRDNFDPIFNGQTKGSIPGINRDAMENSWMVSRKNKLYFAYPAGTSSYPKDLLVWDLSTGKAVHYQYPIYWYFAHVDEYNDRILGVSTDGYIYELEDDDAINDNGTAIEWDVESGEFTSLRKYFPRYARYDVSLGPNASATGSVNLDGESVQDHTINLSRQTRKRLVTTSTGDRLSIRISGEGPVDIYKAEVE